jgi:pimeloyl-ACP methyl ester carboxylesterase
VTVRIERHVRRAGGLRWHWREAGESGTSDAPPLVLLHPSPRSGAMYEGWMPALAASGRVLAIDTPGYGGSDPLPAPPNTMADYVAPLHALLSEVAGPRCVVYGSATGAQLAIAYARQHPQAVQHLVLDNAAHFDDDERAAIVARYFPDLTPRADGSHLLAAWQMVAQMAEYFPWFMADEAHRVSTRKPTATEVHAGVQELLAAGPGWAQAYRCAFEHERASNVMAMSVPTTVCRWQASILLKHIDRLLAHPLPPNVQRLDVPAALPDRFATLTAHLGALRAANTPS